MIIISGTIRDIAIIIVAIQSIVIGVLIAVLIWQIWRLMSMIQTDIKPVIDDTQATVNTVRGTAVFVSDNVVQPVVRTSRSMTRWRRTLQALSSDLVPSRSSPPQAPKDGGPSETSAGTSEPTQTS